LSFAKKSSEEEKKTSKLRGKLDEAVHALEARWKKRGKSWGGEGKVGSLSTRSLCAKERIGKREGRKGSKRRGGKTWEKKGEGRKLDSGGDRCGDF